MSDQVMQHVGSHDRVVEDVDFEVDDPQEARHDFYVCRDCGYKADTKAELAKHPCHKSH